MSAKEFIERVRLDAELRLPLAKSRDAIALVLYGRRYGAVLAAEDAGHRVEVAPTQEWITEVSKRYRVTGDVIRQTAHRILVEEGQTLREKLGPHAKAAVASLRRVVAAVEEARQHTDRSWADWIDTDEVLDVHGNQKSFDYDSDVEPFNRTLDDAITSDGFSLPADIRRLFLAAYGDEGSWKAQDLEFLHKLEAQYPVGRTRAAKARRGFWLGMNFWLAPDFDVLEPQLAAGSIEAPRLNNLTFDYKALHSFLAELFLIDRKRLYIGNDFIDQTVPHMRMAGRLRGPIDCNDFARELLARSKLSRGQLVDVRKAWEPIQLIKDRSNAPPPCATPFDIRCLTVDESAHMLEQLRVCLGITAGTMESILTPEAGETEGTLREPSRLRVSQVFGMPYKPCVTLGRPVHDEFPDWMARGLRAFERE
jgi:hypothetical protein